MLVEIGNAAPLHKVDGGLVPLPGPAVTYVRFPDADEGGLGGLTMPDAHSDDLFPPELARALASVTDPIARRLVMDGWLAHPSRVHGLPNHEMLAALIDPCGLWVEHSRTDASWVASDHPVFAEMVSDLHRCPIGRPADLEDAHWTLNGMPGVGPGPYGNATMLKTNFGNDMVSLLLGGGLLGETGTATATSATTLTTNSATSHLTNDLIGQTVIAWSSGAYGLITGNTSGTNTVLTIPRWVAPATPGGSAASTPSATTGYTIMAGSLPAFFMGLTATATSPAVSDTTLAGEITTASGGLIRKICTYAHTASASTFTLTGVFTANGSDSLPVTIAKMGISQSLISTVNSIFQTLLNATATLTVSGDQLTVTDTFTIT